VNPPIEIIDAPSQTKSFVLIVDDPDAPAGDWVHWILFNIPPNTKKIEENSIPHGAKQGMNDFKILEYKGPCPPSGSHRYFVKLYALDVELDLIESSNKSEIQKAMHNHILDKDCN